MKTHPSLISRVACTLVAVAGLSAITAFAAEPEAPAPVTARTWLNAQTSGTLASPHQQKLSGPVMTLVHQKLLRQLGSGKTSGAGSTGNGGDSKDKSSGDLSKALGDAIKP